MVQNFETLNPNPHKRQDKGNQWFALQQEPPEGSLGEAALGAPQDRVAHPIPPRQGRDRLAPLPGRNEGGSHWNLGCKATPGYLLATSSRCIVWLTWRL